MLANVKNTGYAKPETKYKTAVFNLDSKRNV